MPLTMPVAPTRLAIFALESGTALPIARMPVYAEIVVRAQMEEQAVAVDGRLDDPILQALRKDAPENIHAPQPRQRLADVIGQEIARQLGPKADDILRASTTGDPVEFIAKVISRVRDAFKGATLRSLDNIALEQALKSAIREEAGKRSLPLEPLAKAMPTLWAYPLGVLATDHAGYLSYDLSALPATVLQAVAAAVQARRLDPLASLDVSISLYPTGLRGEAIVDALSQGRFTLGAIVARVDIAKPLIPDAVLNLALPAMQSPSLGDWRLSPGSFASNPGSLIGADGCESILPANVAAQEFFFYQVIRLTDVAPPVAPVAPGQVQLGVVNEYRIAWNPLGHSLGQILYSLPLAPAESVNLAVIDWTRRDEAQRKERTTVDEQLVHNEHRDRSISEAVHTAVQEYQHGSSFMGGIAGAGGGSSGSASAGIAGSLGGSTSSSSGTREVTGSTVQNLSDNITQVSASVRELQSTVVVQSTQSEKEAIETRTVVNYNHSHALTILYYEVLRHFRVVTELTRQRPAVLIRIRTDWFEGAAAVHNILEHRAVLAPALLDTRFADGFDALERLSRLNGQLADLSKPLPLPSAPPSPDPNAPPLFHYFTFELTTGGFHREVDAHDQHVDVLSTLLLGDGGAIDLINTDGGKVLNNFGAFSQENTVNVFTAVPSGRATVPWPSITGVIFAIAVFPTNVDTAKVSFSHIKLTGIDGAGPPGVVLIDQPYEHGHLIVTNANDEFGRRLTLPALRPNSLPAPAPQFSDADLKDRARSIELIAHLESHKRFYSRTIALNQDRFERASELDAILFSDSSTALGHLENRPLEVVGDYLAYPSTDRMWNALVSAKVEADGDPESALAAVPDERLVTLPTRGVFAEAKLGHCNASEEIDNTRFWDWQQSPIPHFAPEIAPTVPVTPHPEQPNLSATPFPNSIVNIVNPPNAPDPTGLAAALKVLGTPNIFRDMSGTQEVAQLLQTLANDATALAKGSAGGGAASGGGRATSSPSVGGAPGINGPRANPTQPSAVNSDLRDLQKVLGSGQAAGLITPAAAQDVFTDAARDAYNPALQLGFAIDAATAATVNLGAVPLAVGQIVRTEVREAGGGGGAITTWSHDYPIEPSGNLRIPFVAPVAARGQTVTQLRNAIASAIVAAKLFPAVTVNLDILSAQVDYTNAIKVGEKLFIRILESGGKTGVLVSPSSGSYIVDNSGNINFPFLNLIKVSGSLIVDIQNQIEQGLISQKILTSPTVNVTRILLG